MAGTIRVEPQALVQASTSMRYAAEATDGMLQELVQADLELLTAWEGEGAAVAQCVTTMSEYYMECLTQAIIVESNNIMHAARAAINTDALIASSLKAE
jgi:uncharacterized protein YukE